MSMKKNKMDGNQELKWVQNATANFGQCRWGPKR